MTRKTKIVATMGPASAQKKVLKEMIVKGVNVCRLNFSHGSHDDHKKTVDLIREIDQELETNTAILADLQGPKIRVGEMANNGVEIKNGDTFTFTTNEIVGNEFEAYLSYSEFPNDVEKGEKILLDDGKLLLEVLETNNKDSVKTKVLHGGILSSNKGVNLPNTRVSLPCLTDKDLKDLEYALTLNVDWIGLSFVRSARDIIELRHIISTKNSNAKIIAKIEKPEAVQDIVEIVKETDAIMVARGDLGVEIPMQNVPLLQKEIVKTCLAHAKPVIIATQMMESMISNVSPTRAEVNDVANAVMDGADAVMLSGETSVGKFPIHVIDAMGKIIDHVEAHSDDIYHFERVPEKNQKRFITDSICFNATRLANRVDAKAIVTMTHSGYTGFKISSQRPRAKIFVFSSNRSLLTSLSLVWGVEAIYYDKMVSTDHTIADIKYLLHKTGRLKKGDLVINTASMPIEEKGNTNMLKLSNV